MNNDFQNWASNCQARIEAFLEARLPASDCVPERLHKAMRYSVLGGGKRVRPLLSFAAGELAVADVERVTIVAAAVELIHAYSLVHDDLPCMDDDILRRGKPTCHVEFDEATALLTGDSLQTLAFELLAEKRIADAAETQLEMIAQLALASGSRGMAGGQAFDLDSVGKMLSLPELEFMHIHKTGALIRAAVMLERVAVVICVTNNWRNWIILPNVSVWLFKSLTIYLIPKRRPRRLARLLEKMRSIISQRMSVFWGSTKPVNWPRNSSTMRTRHLMNSVILR